MLTFTAVALVRLKCYGAKSLFYAYSSHRQQVINIVSYGWSGYRPKTLGRLTIVILIKKSIDTCTGSGEKGEIIIDNNLNA